MVFGVHNPYPSSPACLVGPSIETAHIQLPDSLPQSPSSLPSSVSADARLPNCAHTPTSNPFPISVATNLAQAPSCPMLSLGGLSASSLIPLWQPGAAFEKGNSGNVTPCLETPQWSPHSSCHDRKCHLLKGTYFGPALKPGPVVPSPIHSQFFSKRPSQSELIRLLFCGWSVPLSVLHGEPVPGKGLVCRSRCCDPTAQNHAWCAAGG